jgi:acetoin:2,6-dichlorophenolindophenol oxidoreductase subunit alpha
LEDALKGDPLAKARHTMARLGLVSRQFDELWAQAQAEVALALASADAAAWPTEQAAFTDIQDVGAGVWQ